VDPITCQVSSAIGLPPKWMAAISDSRSLTRFATESRALLRRSLGGKLSTGSLKKGMTLENVGECQTGPRSWQIEASFAIKPLAGNGIELREVRKQEGSAIERGEMNCRFGGETDSLDG
jgi:hypothetical protein